MPIEGLVKQVANGVRRVMELAYSVITQFVQGTPPRAPPQSRSSSEPAQVGSPS